MRLVRPLLLVITTFLTPWVQGQLITYDFDSGPLHSSLPLTLTIDGLNAHFSASPAIYGYSIQQPTDAIGLTPSGFSGYCLAPNTVYQCDLIVTFDQPITTISLLYAPQELATDSSCTMRITAYSGQNQVKTSTAVADPPGVWPTGTLSLSSAAAFDQVAIHYDSPPPTGGDYGPIFVVDNIAVSAVPEPAASAILMLLVSALAGFTTKNGNARQLTFGTRPRSH
jgi:hypothetical protein